MPDSPLPDIAAWIVGLVIAAGWYFARKGRRIRESKEADERAQRDRVDDMLTRSTAIVREFGAFMEAKSGVGGADPTAVYDVASLPYPKETIKSALMLGYVSTSDHRHRAALGGAMAWLCQFQPNVGPTPVSSFGGALDRAYPADQTAMLDAARRIAAWGDSPDYGRWQQLNAIVEAEMAGVVAALKKLDRSAPQVQSPKGARR